MFTFVFHILLLISFSSLNAVEVQKAKVGEIELAYYTRGSGDPMILIIGYRRTMSDWDPTLLDELAKQYKLIIFDNRGAGLSTDTEENKTTIEQMADDTAGLINTLGFKKVHVLGWSMGSRIAQTVAIRHPEVVDKLILAATNPGGEHRVEAEENVRKVFTSHHTSNKEHHSLMFPNNEAAQAYKNRVEKAIAAGSAPNEPPISEETAKRQIHALKHWVDRNENYKALRHIKIPTLVADGLEDVLDPPENSRIVADRIPFAWAAYFPGAGHAFLFQDSERFSKLVILFIGTL